MSVAISDDALSNPASECIAVVTLMMFSRAGKANAEQKDAPRSGNKGSSVSAVP